MTELKNKTKELVSALIWGLLAVVVAVGIIALIDGDKKDDQQEQVERIEKNVQELQKTLSPYEHKEKMNKLLVLTNFSNTAKNEEQTASFKKNLVVRGDFANGYVYVKASADKKALVPGLDDVFLMLGGILDGQIKQFGGHLIEAKSLATPKSLNYTELLYDLSDVKYKESYKNSDVEIVSGDWLKLLNRGARQFVLTFSSTQKSGTIEELSFYYECSSETPCSLSLQD